MTTSTDPSLDIYKLSDYAPDIVPATPKRDWMEQFTARHPYRCLPLAMANSTGWELICPFTIDIHWTGGAEAKDLTFEMPDAPYPQQYIDSHFTSGIATFMTHYIFRTPPGWSLLCMGPPNMPKDGIAPLSGLIETDWLPYTFTMNWQMTRKGTVRFEKGEAFCFITLIEDKRLEPVEPKLREISANPELKGDFEAWRDSRESFVRRMKERDPDALKAPWEKYYMQGQRPGKAGSAKDHVTKRRLKAVKNITGSALMSPPKTPDFFQK